MELWKLGAREAGRLLAAREISAPELTDALLTRIEGVDGKTGAYVTVCPELAEKQAAAAQERLDDGESGALLGVPGGIKDNICTSGATTTCSSKMLEHFTPPYDATVVEKLGAAGAVTLGKLNMDEFAMGGSTETSYFKKTANPWDLTRVPGGSSGGAAVAVAAGEAPFALGSDTGGSIRQPAAFCGVVGLKPTYGAVSRYGLVAFASSLDQIGPITRNVEDTAVVLDAICGRDAHDSTSADYAHPSYTATLGKGIKGMKIALPKEYLGDGLAPSVKHAILAAAKELEKLGAVCEEVSLPATEYAVPAYYLISSAEASSNLARYDGVKYGFAADGCKTLAQLVTRTRDEGFGREVKRRIILGTYALSAGYYDAYYKKALQVRRIIKNGFDSVFADYDLILGPTAPTTAYKLGEKSGDPLSMYLGDIYTVPVNIAGLPALSINCGYDEDGLPIGMQLIGPAFGEPALLQAAYAYEQATPDAHKQPVIA
ncbi:Asp-tRNA(Asn)/Glu-tRNA(Gln) amidotransferase subunit GatA [Ethanoligenens harbinense]|uniref:Glutamyl-tRNA(Gln) amidotransferase subunit A n=1 Tax=Ethanoligenens harbinense (strain DSM 18485 / JCM 12961 / CGMCC 1.5033 / YUAN-3) TaxID=663278 RepID=E6U4M5_ETHHY|nr:Asp-tRNA(Asn)/Glu-tRNA(Gln) amidotransferase subunit GatA [Ethanoligenens harbinense]ADU26653.1 glutamyl-tRNA(Gln) amidotransferase, A subunit [Ethanoligenens harbinense YUAN-3]AVQ95772.1 Asp-tRNA(Asn)/Glu-tRNA(Gln) amidotransferase subunit GatA [Ethanoligenens harbinense YUAN-3]AYF38434.1 Asp-tRNA(Asn)/Glu-tRNA(Gln) amidotransferase subunit GatA [Ethanoligenens harbinense]AYF41179.1 Asp-tRNA(Asn)/Glu-tRNA(Gln) amidotransferase subunit GatA [Ethanoligenens harbinense]QCN92011.1 Asp-tRNA(Asn